MLKYECVVGSWSSCLLDAVAMGMPVINLNYEDYPSDGYCEWLPGKIELFKICDAKKIPVMLGNKALSQYDPAKVEYILGPLGKINEKLVEFLKKSLR